MTEPISPNDIDDIKKNSIPNEVVEAFNQLIIKKWNGNKAIIRQDDVISLVLDRMPEGTTKNTIFSNRWLDVEDLFEEKGWHVEYDKPGYNETYSAKFIFTRE